MAGEDISMESSKLKHRKMDRDDRCDGISNLPDAVLLHILSFLPMRDAVRTVMVPGFRYLWTSIRDLSFDHCAYHDCNEEDPAFKVDDRFVNFIDHVLTLHENPTIDWFRLSLNYAAEVCADDPQYQDGATKETRKSNKIDTWINFAVRRKVKFLDLNFLACTRKLPNNLYMLPSIVLSCSYLVELTLASCVVEPVGQVQLRSLRKLFMKQIDLTDKKLANILSGSPLLKELSLEDCDGLCEPKFCSGPSIEELNLEECGSLKKLDLTRSDIKHLTIDHSQHLELICPNVKILDIAGCLTYVKVTNMPSLVDTSICFSHYVRYSHEEFSEFRLLLEKLNCSPYFMPCDLCMLVAEQGWKPAFEFNGFSYWSSVDGAFPCLEHQLKHVKIYGSVIEPDVIELIEFLLKNAQILEKMEISTKKTLQRTRSTYMFSSDVGPPSKDYCTSDALLEFSQKLLSFPRALTRAVIHLG
ncbi:F-box/FBD/LRR-repeat protein At5g56420-like isoform X2 [Rhodamnia argentea]|uniref:F-box/FBD/LRR-repeat protein At5g56420-like isoform X2 n=1 Tax=Rhodamnia argentea TaxID=178133 RepID=A0ABM3H9S8_9MYRT|nr:F-box/FBD/LRR-repeat protein At5g56420-like isoform X2 [Rhodamnia argentea]